MNLSHNENLFLNTGNIQNETDLKKALINLDKKLNAINRNVSFGDVFNVTQVLLTESDLTSKLALLNIGEAAIVNANVLSDGNENRYRGDIAYRKTSGELIWIPAENKGVYKPKITYESDPSSHTGMLNLTYTYTSAATDGESFSVELDATTTNAYLINEDINDENASGGVNNTFTFNALLVNSEVLKPIIKFYLKSPNSDALEELYGDCPYVINNTNPKTISITLPINRSDMSSGYFANYICYMRVR